MIKIVVYILALLLTACCIPASTSGFGRGCGAVLREELKFNTVRITAYWGSNVEKHGFGFLIEECNDSGKIITVSHLLFGDRPDERYDSIIIGYFDDPTTEKAMHLHYNLDLDIAIIKAPVHKGLAWQKECLGEEGDISKGKNVWYIGRNEEWYLPTKLGVIHEVERKGEVITIEGLNINKGTSGAPLIGEHGIIGMITDAGIDKAVALGFPAIEYLVKDWEIVWQVDRCKGPGHTGVYVGAGIGGGIARFDRDHDIGKTGDQSGIHIGLKLGYGISDLLSIGFENDVWYKDDGGLIYKYDSYALMGTVYLTDDFYARAGPSLAFIKAEPAAIIKRRQKVGLAAGIGLEKQLGERLFIAPGIDFRYHSLDIFSAYHISFSLSLIWYWQEVVLRI